MKRLAPLPTSTFPRDPNRFSHSLDTSLPSSWHPSDRPPSSEPCSPLATTSFLPRPNILSPRSALIHSHQHGSVHAASKSARKVVRINQEAFQKDQNEEKLDSHQTASFDANAHPVSSSSSPFSALPLSETLFPALKLHPLPVSTSTYKVACQLQSDDPSLEEEEKRIYQEEKRRLEKLTARSLKASKPQILNQLLQGEVQPKSQNERSYSKDLGNECMTSEESEDEDMNENVSARKSTSNAFKLRASRTIPLLSTTVVPCLPFEPNTSQGTLSVTFPESIPVKPNKPRVDPIPQPKPLREIVSGVERILSVFIGTWNMHGKPAPADEEMRSWLPLHAFDLYAVGTEECDEMSIEKAVFVNSMGNGRKAKWCKRLLSLIGEEEYELLEEEGMVAMHIAVFVRKSLRCQVRDVTRSRVATGVGDFIGNKGGVAISFCFGRTSFLFVNSHLSAHHNAVERRNADFAKINSKLALRLRNFRRESSFSRLACENFDRVFWFGDLNYRVEGSYAIVTHLITAGMHEVLLNNDQLRQERTHGRVFQGFFEAPLSFNPTYKIEPRQSKANASNADRVQYDLSSKRRVPGYTDRILWKDQTHSDSTECQEYGSVESIVTSDHFPVYAYFRVRVEGL